MIWIWRFLLGYLLIKIQGENAEQILNIAAANGINIWDLRYKNRIISGNISIRDFLKLRQVKRDVKCKISIIKKYGLIFELKKHKARTGMLIGCAFFVFILLFLSNYVWVINVEGNSSIKNEEILASCKKIGIYEGVLKNKINGKYDSQRLQLSQKGIAWCSLNVEGCVLTVNVSEVVNNKKETTHPPSNLKSKTDGKIKKIDVKNGEVCVKIGDVVSKGDLLVSGVTTNNSSNLFVHSEGEIIAETKRTFSAQGDFCQKITQETGETKKRFTVSFFNVKMPLFLGNLDEPYYYKSTVKETKLFDKKIPIKIACEEFNFTRETTITYDSVTLENMLYSDIKKQLESFKFINAVEYEKELITTEKGMLLKITYICEENIAIQDEILFDGAN